MGLIGSVNSKAREISAGQAEFPCRRRNLFTSRRDIMGTLVNSTRTKAAAIGVAVVISALNLFLLAQTFGLMG